MTSNLHPVHMTHEINSRRGRQYFGIPVDNYVEFPQNIRLCHISPPVGEQNILYMEVHRVDTGPGEPTDEEKKMESQLAQQSILEVYVRSQSVGEENFSDKKWFRWFVSLAT